MTGAEDGLPTVAESSHDHGGLKRFKAMEADVRVRRADQVAYSLHMVTEIAVAYDRAVDEGEFLVARCMLDAFYVHLRLLGDFLIMKTKSYDFGPEDFGVMGWDAPKGPEHQRLEQGWHVASKYVVHFGHPRVPEDLQDLARFELGGKAFRRHAEDALVLFSNFVDRVDAERPLWAGSARLPDPDTEPDAWDARAWSDAADILRAASERAHNLLSQNE